MSDEFFVGYLPTPPATARRMRSTAAALVLAAAALAAALALATGPFDRARFEYGTVREWTGTIEARPVPVLIVRERPDDSAFGRLERFPLVAPGKHGAGAMVAPFDGERVVLRGTRIVREGTTMIELAAGAIDRAPDVPSGDAPPPASRVVDLGRTSLAGEIVDSKCFLGVMNPGRLEVHRACAMRCIAGGIPPMLFARQADGREARLLLVDASGGPIGDRVLSLVARPVTIVGRVERRDDLDYLYVDSIDRTP